MMLSDLRIRPGISIGGGDDPPGDPRPRGTPWDFPDWRDRGSPGNRGSDNTVGFDEHEGSTFDPYVPGSRLESRFSRLYPTRQSSWDETSTSRDFWKGPQRHHTVHTTETNAAGRLLRRARQGRLDLAGTTAIEGGGGLVPTEARRPTSWPTPQNVTAIPEGADLDMLGRLYQVNRLSQERAGLEEGDPNRRWLGRERRIYLNARRPENLQGRLSELRDLRARRQQGGDDIA